MGKRTNCVVFALLLWWRRVRHRGRYPHARRYFPIARMSDWGYFPHVLYLERSRHGRLWQVSYKPVDPRKRPFPPLLFVGKVEFGDRKNVSKC